MFSTTLISHCEFISSTAHVVRYICILSRDGSLSFGTKCCSSESWVHSSESGVGMLH